MSATSEISWTDATWPVIRGCSKISDGCKFCWAIRDAHVHAGIGHPQAYPNPAREKAAAHFQGLTRIENGRPNWTGVVRLDESILDWPLKWRKSKRIFVASSGDLFHESLSRTDIDRVLCVIEDCYWHTFQVLTKRDSRMRSHMAGWSVLPNLLLGVSVEDRAHLSRIDDLRATPAAVRFVSFEPLLEDLGAVDLTGIDWAIVGGESGPGARPMHPDWVRSLRDQCVAAGVKFFFKQWGAAIPVTANDDCGVLPEKWQRSAFWLLPDGSHIPPDEFANVASYRNVDYAYSMVPVGKKAAGCLLDGREWRELP